MFGLKVGLDNSEMVLLIFWNSGVWWSMVCRMGFEKNHGRWWCLVDLESESECRSVSFRGDLCWSFSRGLFEEAVPLRLQGMREWWKEFSSNYRQISDIHCPLKLFLFIPHYWRPSNLEWNPPIHASCQKHITLQLRFSQYWRIKASKRLQDLHVK